jgi:hypothetical protein
MRQNNFYETLIKVSVATVGVVCVIVLLAGCTPATTMPSPGDRGQMSYERACDRSGGVLYKGPMDREYTCVDRATLRDLLRSW